MTVLAIELSDERIGRLRALAERAGVEPEEFLRQQVEELLDTPKKDIREVAEYIVRKNAELYRRLA